MASPEEILNKLLQSGNSVDPNQQVDISPYLPTYSGTPEQEAQSSVNLQYNPQQRDLLSAQKQAGQETAQNISEQQAYGQIVDPRLANVYSALGTSLTQNREDTAKNYQTAVDRIRSFYDQAGQSNQQLNTDVLGRITQQAQGLGLDAALPGATQGLNRDYAFAQQQGNQAKADSSANLTSLAAQIFGLDTGRISSSEREGASVRSQAQMDTLNAIAKLRQEGQKEQADYLEKLTGLKQDKANALADMVNKMKDQRSQDSITARKSAIDEFLQRANLGQSQRSEQAGLAQFLMGQAEQKREFDVGQANENARAAAARAASASRKSGSSGNPLADLLKIAQIENIQSNVANRSKKKLTGQEALDQLLNSKSAYWSTSKPGAVTGITGMGKAKRGPAQTVQHESAGPKFRAAVGDIITKAHQLSLPQAKSKSNPMGSPKKDPYQMALSLAGTKAYKNMNQNALRAGIDAYFKGYDVPGQTDDLLGLLMAQYLGG